MRVLEKSELIHVSGGTGSSCGGTGGGGGGNYGCPPKHKMKHKGNNGFGNGGGDGVPGKSGKDDTCR